MNFEDIWKIRPYETDQKEKEKLLTKRLLELTRLHQQNCLPYSRMLRSAGFDAGQCRRLEEIPFLPVRLFKQLSLKSVPDEQIIKTMTSSGTTGQEVSRIYLDRTTAADQQKAMVKIVSSFTGAARMPMIVIDSRSVVKNRVRFSARGAGILGFSMFGSKIFYALDDDMKLDVKGLLQFLALYGGQKILLFGFTFMVWQHFYQELERLKADGICMDLSDAVLIHGGGWKKLISMAVGPAEFRSRLRDVCGIVSVHDYYGMVEQTGSIYMECGYGHLHASIFSDIIIRRPIDFTPCATGEKGLIQTVSVLPVSYPGHSLLTEDEGVLEGVDDCPCGRKGKYFKITGRLKHAVLRGCSDTYAANFESTGP